MRNGRGTLTALHLLLVWATMATAVPMLGFGLVAAAWGGGTGATVPVLFVGVPLALGLLTVAGLPARTVVPLCGSMSRRLGWAVLVFVLGTLGILAGLAAYGGDVDLGSAETRLALTGVPYAVAAAFFVPSRWVRWGALAVLAAGVAYGGVVGPAQARQRQHEAETARYRERAALLHLGDAPPGMRVAHAQVGPASFVVDYRPVREGYEEGYVGLVVRTPLTPALRCPEFAPENETCTVTPQGEMIRVGDIPGSTDAVTLTRRHRSAEVEVSSQTLDERGLRRLLDTLHPLSDAELRELMKEKRIVRSL
ncbi:hypothetical protein [Streptomyces geysiriensis]|uniref:hypothetical protein n=1 Tax=Streptomyces geysiriensis TaxID=68207 RepID=UPI0027E04E98|nr:hypothetical protein [Streptomyces geysiriensis]